jgi:hypothetical protein
MENKDADRSIGATDLGTGGFVERCARERQGKAVSSMARDRPNTSYSRGPRDGVVVNPILHDHALRARRYRDSFELFCS